MFIDAKLHPENTLPAYVENLHLESILLKKSALDKTPSKMDLEAFQRMSFFSALAQKLDMLPHAAQLNFGSNLL